MLQPTEYAAMAAVILVGAIIGAIVNVIRKSDQR